MGQRISDARHKAGYVSAEAFARKVPVSGWTVRSWEAGKTRPRYKNLERIAELTGKSKAWLLGDEESEMAEEIRKLTQLLAAHVDDDRLPNSSVLAEQLVLEECGIPDELYETPDAWQEFILLARIFADLSEADRQHVVDVAATLHYARDHPPTSTEPPAKMPRVAEEHEAKTGVA